MPKSASTRHCAMRLPLPLRAKCAALIDTVQYCSTKFAASAALAGFAEELAAL